MIVTNNTASPIALSVGVVLLPKQPTEVACWNQIENLAVVKAWVERGVLSLDIATVGQAKVEEVSQPESKTSTETEDERRERINKEVASMTRSHMREFLDRLRIKYSKVASDSTLRNLVAVELIATEVNNVRHTD